MLIPPATPSDLLCFSHLPWDVIFQRPQHLMSRFAKLRRVFFIEEPLASAVPIASLRYRICPETGVHIVTPLIPASRMASARSLAKPLLSDFIDHQVGPNPVAWVYSPKAIEMFPENLAPSAICYDCTDDPKGFKLDEKRLLTMSDVVFTGGVSLFEAKCNLHPSVHAFPNSVDADHFATARSIRASGSAEPLEQRDLPHPRLGYSGIIDERLDLNLIADLARLRPEWHFVMIGPVVQIDPASLPQAPNLHWLGPKRYRDLPAYFAGWDIGLVPFHLNDSTRFLSPAKTLEYLSAGLPVISTPIPDVIRPYGKLGLATLAADAPAFIRAAERAMICGVSLKWRQRTDAFLRMSTWDATWTEMNRLIQQVHRPPVIPNPLEQAAAVSSTQ
jgi:glycosyltransferase involved in cell wall biosynthesis